MKFNEKSYKNLLLQQLGHNGPNVLDHVLHQDDVFAQSNMAAMDLSLKKKNAKMPKTRVFNQFLILWQKGFNTARC